MLIPITNSADIFLFIRTFLLFTLYLFKRISMSKSSSAKWKIIGIKIMFWTIHREKKVFGELLEVLPAPNLVMLTSFMYIYRWRATTAKNQFKEWKWYSSQNISLSFNKQFQFGNSCDRFSLGTDFRARSNIFMNCLRCLFIPLSIGHVSKHSLHIAPSALCDDVSMRSASPVANNKCSKNRCAQLSPANFVSKCNR